MDDGDRAKFYLEVRQIVEGQPDMAALIQLAVVDALQAVAKRARQDQAAWEGIAMSALEPKLFATSRRPALADRIADVAGRSCFNWHSVIEKLRGK